MDEGATAPIPALDDPRALFELWFREAEASEPRDANAMTVASVDAVGMPRTRTVLLKGQDDRGFVFYTNLESDKGRDLLARPKASLLFYWKSRSRQVRIEGAVERVGDGEADDYFASRPRGSQIGAWASDQSRELADAGALIAAVAAVEARYRDRAVPRPPHWSGFRVLPARFEFWQERPFRLHDRLVYRRDEAGGGWHLARLYP